IAVVAATASFASLIGAADHALAWTTSPFRPAWQVVTDSNVDWGQDYDALRRWSATHHPYAAYFGPRGRSAAGIPGARKLLDVDRAHVSGWVAVSATLITGDRADALGWLRAYCPVGSLNGS